MKKAKNIQRDLFEKHEKDLALGVEPSRSFCARVINLCYYVEDANTLTDINALKTAAKSIRNEAMGLQTIYGGMAPPPKEST